MTKKDIKRMLVKCLNDGIEKTLLKKVTLDRFLTCLEKNQGLSINLHNNHTHLNQLKKARLKSIQTCSLLGKTVMLHDICFSLLETSIKRDASNFLNFALYPIDSFNYTFSKVTLRIVIQNFMRFGNV